MPKRRIQWGPVCEHAAEIVNSYEIAVTLRQVFYRLLADGTLDNSQGHYKTLSRETAERRRTGAFPPLFDLGRRVYQPASWADVPSALRDLAEQYRLPRTADQDMSIWLAVEKNALAGLLSNWFDELGLPVLPLGGYSSQSIDQLVLDRARADGRPAVLIYGGDFDASGMDIGRNFVAQTAGIWTATHRIALSEQQITDLALPVNPGKETDSRSEGFIAAHRAIHADYENEPGFGWKWVGKGARRQRKQVPVQIELDAVEPLTLRGMYQDVIDTYLDMSKFEARKALETAHVARLSQLADDADGPEHEAERDLT